jgi:hypothetical protein
MGADHMQLRTELEIAAPPERVWSVLTDFSAYHEWNPFITAIRGDVRVGERLRVTLNPPESDEASFSPRVLVFDPPHELRWRGHLLFKGLFDGEHFFQCKETANGGTRFVHGEDFGGLLLKFAMNRLKNVARGFVYMNEALKKRVESRPAERGA